ncbi:MAG: hypothetical protein A2X46_08810 [Lentisphaerae bacterium GWF2_57_35]|nr:MAG: hypothetical protein A2X46_08810 [Lentisphaerae bacterium GWF2_57_35]
MVVVAIPCHNEASTIAKVVRDFQVALPQAEVHVFDNQSIDGSAELAAQAGAKVHYVHRRGKGRVMRAILDSITADALVIVDGDDTYYAEDAAQLVVPVLQGEVDMVVGNRLDRASTEALNQLHLVGNHMIVTLINKLFGVACRDILSGYRVLNRRLVETICLLSPGFETETELTVRALAEDMVITEMPVSYRARPAGSESKLRTFHDGYRILRAALVLLRDLYPMRLFGLIGLFCYSFVAGAGLLRLLVYAEWLHISTALLTGLILLFAPLGFLAFGMGLFLDAVNSHFRALSETIRRKKI